MKYIIINTGNNGKEFFRVDETQASKIIEEYLTGQSSEADFDLALAYLKTAPKPSDKLAELFRDLDLLGGLSHEETHELMPYYLEPLSRDQLSPMERRQFVAHLTQCPTCAQDYLELRGFEAEVTAFRKAEQATVYAEPEPKHWPILEASLQTLYQTKKLLSYSISFSPTFRETNPLQPLTEYSELFDDSLDETASNGIAVAVVTWRNGPTSCDLQIELTDSLDQGRQSGQTILVSYDNQQATLTTDPNGEAIRPGLEIDKLATLKLQIEIKPA